MSGAAQQVLVIGCGLTGAVVTRLLAASATAAAPLALTIWDKARGAGGRFNTHRSSLPGEPRADTGAQYITKGVHAPDIAPDESLYAELLQREILQPFTGAIHGDKGELPNFIAPAGLSSVVRHFATSSGASLAFEKRVTGLSLSAADPERTKTSEVGKRRRWVTTCEDGSSDAFDAVVVTIPVPQILELRGEVAALLEGHRPALGKVEYSSRYALSLYYDQEKALEMLAGLPWTAKYVKEDDCIRYVSVETRKHANGAEKALESSRQSEGAAAGAAAAAALLVHTSVPFGLQHLDSPAEDVETAILTSLGRVLPGLPAPVQTKLSKWRYSQARTPFEGKPGALLICGGSGDAALPPLVLAGDGFVASAFDGCVSSAKAAANALQEAIREGNVAMT